MREFEPYKNLWTTTADWQKWQEAWMNEPLSKIDPEALEHNISTRFAYNLPRFLRKVIISITCQQI